MLLYDYETMKLRDDDDGMVKSEDDNGDEAKRTCVENEGGRTGINTTATRGFNACERHCSYNKTSRGRAGGRRANPLELTNSLILTEEFISNSKEAIQSCNESQSKSESLLVPYL